MRVAVFRAAADGRRTGERLTALGHVPILAPVLEIVPTGASPPDDTTGILVFTSAQAPLALARHTGSIDHLRHLPCWCVGNRTADAARGAGFIHVVTGPGDAANLAKRIAQSHDGSPVTLVAGRDRKPDLEAGLRRHGIEVSTIEAYAAEPATSWSIETVDALRNAEAAMHYSRRSAELAHALSISAGLEAHVQRWRHYCLSEDVAAALRDRGISDLQISARPDEDHLLTMMPDLRS